MIDGTLQPGAVTAMESTRRRAREMLPAIIITVLSMIQALALELFWSRLQDSDYLWLGGTDALVGWLQFAVLLLGIVEIWLLYISLMLRFSWLPSMADTTVPFLIGLMEFALIDMIGPGDVGPWFVLLGMLFGVVLAMTRVSLRKARNDPENHWFFSEVPPQNWLDRLLDMGVVLLLVTLGVLLWFTQLGAWLAIGSLVIALLALVWQMTVTWYYWSLLLRTGPGGENEDSRQAQPDRATPEN